MEENIRPQLIIGFGPAEKPFKKQLQKQGLNFDAKKVKYFQKLGDSITHLWVSSLINDPTRAKLQQKLFTKIKKHLMKKNKL